MDKHEPVSDEKYEGPTKTTIALGKAKMFGWLGTFTGLVVGAIAAGAIAPENGRWVKKGKDFFSEFLNIEVEGKNAVRAGGAFLGSFVGHYIGVLFGVHRGLQGAGRGKEQFELVKKQRNEARAEVRTLKQAAATPPALDQPQTAVEAGSVALEAKEPKAMEMER